MDVMIYLIPLAIVMALMGLGALFWSLSSHQYDDLDGAAYRILLDDDEGKTPSNIKMQTESDLSADHTSSK